MDHARIAAKFLIVVKTVVIKSCHLVCYCMFLSHISDDLFVMYTSGNKCEIGLLFGHFVF